MLPLAKYSRQKFQRQQNTTATTVLALADRNKLGKASKEGDIANVFEYKLRQCTRVIKKIL